jgi:hypothetical protein
LIHIPSPFFCFHYFSNRVLCLCQVWPGPPFSYLWFLHGWNDKRAPSHPASDRYS